MTSQGGACTWAWPSNQLKVPHYQICFTQYSRLNKLDLVHSFSLETKTDKRSWVWKQPPERNAFNLQTQFHHLSHFTFLLSWYYNFWEQHWWFAFVDSLREHKLVAKTYFALSFRVTQFQSSLLMTSLSPLRTVSSVFPCQFSTAIFSFSVQTLHLLGVFQGYHSSNLLPFGRFLVRPN